LDASIVTQIHSWVYVCVVLASYASALITISLQRASAFA